jgi:hypothetical protein
MKEFKIVTREDLLMQKYMEVVELASHISAENRTMAMQKLKEAAQIKEQIEELRKAKLN